MSPFTIRRRAALAVLLAATAVLPARAADMTKLKVVLGYIPDVEMYGAEYALHQGLFKAEGLDVTLIPAGQGVDQVQMVASGAADIGIANAEPILAATEKGEKFKVFASLFQRSPVAMTCRKDSGVTKPTDLAGKTVGVKTLARPYFDLFMSTNHVDPATVKTVSIGGSDISTLIAGRIACEITTFAFNEPLEIQQAGVETVVMPLGDYGLNSQPDSYFVKAAYFDSAANRDVLTRYLRAESKAWATFFADPKAAAKYTVDGDFVDGLDMQQQTFQAVQQADYMRDKLTAEKGIMWINPGTWKETARNIAAAKVTDSVVDPTPLLTFDILEAAKPPKF
jgi:NitT/TauT family transport system substrate-binding protein